MPLSNRSFRLAISASSVAVALAGCSAPPQIDALDGLLSARDAMGSEQDALLALHSLALTPGVIVRIPEECPPSRFSAAALVEHSEADKSAMRVETFVPQLAAADMQTIRVALETVQQLAGQRINKEVDKTREAATKRQQLEQLQKAASEQRDVQQQALDVAAKRDAWKKSLADTLSRAVAGGDGPAIDDAVKAIRGALETDPRGSSTSEPAPDAAVLEKEIAATSARLDALTQSIQQPNDIDEAQRQLTVALSKPNVMVFRWRQTNGKSGSASFGELFDASGSSDEAVEGYVVMNGLRRARLIVGKDFAGSSGEIAAALRGVSDSPRLTSDDRSMIVTSVLQTHDIMYFAAEDLTKQVKAQLEYAAASAGAGGLTAADLAELKIKIALELRRARSIQNSGYFASPTIAVQPIADWSQRRSAPVLRSAADGAGAAPDSDAWITVHAVTMRVKDLLELRRSRDAGAGTVTPPAGS